MSYALLYGHNAARVSAMTEMHAPDINPTQILQSTPRFFSTIPRGQDGRSKLGGTLPALPVGGAQHRMCVAPVKHSRTVSRNPNCKSGAY